MGSSGSGMFGTYRNGGAGSLGVGSIEKESGCPARIEQIRLEDVAISEYYLKYENVPSVGMSVELAMQTVGKRLVVISKDTKEVIGNLPVRYNYLNLCIQKGKSYFGNVLSSGLKPIPYVVVNLYAR